MVTRKTSIIQKNSNASSTTIKKEDNNEKEKPCKCKVGRCYICGSKCKRCKCACDGVAPKDALARKPGAQIGGRRKININDNERKSSGRLSKKARVNYADDQNSISSDEDDKIPIEFMRVYPRNYAEKNMNQDTSII